MNGWGVTVAVLATVTGLLAWVTLRPWGRCRPCRGHGTQRHRRSGKFTRHCPRCRGYGRVERPARRFLRKVTGEQLCRRPPRRPYDGMALFGGQVPFAGRRRGGRPRRRGGW